MGPPGREKDGMDAARVIDRVCVIAIVGTFLLVVFLGLTYDIENT